MSERMNGADTPHVLAGEYVLGTLDGDERSQAQNLLAADGEFAAKVKVWERRLGELHLMVEPVEPDAAIWERIRAKLPETEQQAAVPEPDHVEPVSAPPADDAAARFDAAIAAISEVSSAPIVETPAAPTSERSADELAGDEFAAPESAETAPPAETAREEVATAQLRSADSASVATPLVPAEIPEPGIGRAERRAAGRLGELHLMVEPVEPDAAIWERIRAKLPETEQQAAVPEPDHVEPRHHSRRPCAVRCRPNSSTTSSHKRKSAPQRTKGRDDRAVSG
ncbi:MAG: hypothetical protein E6G76_28430 [Alphaproteobacteria bacterium]|nr:MAG: hypothetical protein E6G76_28430 [Alphaproteobacteria bacterium]